MTHRWLLYGAAGLALGLGAASCGASANDAGSAAPGDWDDAGMNGSGGASGGGATNDAAPPPEQELESSFRTPVVIGTRVWSANPESGRIAVVDANTLEITTVQAGFGPTWLTAVPATDGDAAIVLNVLGHDATLLRAEPGGDFTTRSLPTHEGANAWAMGERGRWAVAWTDARLVERADPTDGFQDITVIHLERGRESATRLSVGYRPTQVVIDRAEARAFVVSDPGVSVIALGGAAPTVTGLVEVTADPVDDPAARDVSITPDGELALVRLDGSADLGLVSLRTGSRRTVTLPAPVTDLDLGADGTRAVAALRSTSQVAVLDVPSSLDAPPNVELVELPGEAFGSVSLSEDASVALLYTNAVPSDHVSILELRAGGAPTHRTVSVKTPVQAVFPSPDAAHAIALQAAGPGSAKAGAFSVIPTRVLRAPKLVGTDAPLTAVAIAPAPSTTAVVTERDDAKRIFGAYLARMPSLRVDRIPLASPPMAVGIVPLAKKAFVAQEHPDGRITFIDLETGSARTLTGFELGAKIVD